MSSHTERAAPAIQLINHRRVAEWWDVQPKTIRRWVAIGTFPVPHSEQGTYLFFDRSIIEHRLKTGLWPAGTKFHGMPDDATERNHGAHIP